MDTKINTRVIELIMPMESILTDSFLAELINKALVLGLDTDRFYRGDTLMKRVYLNFIEPDLLAYMVNKYEVNWLSVENLPYYEFKKDKDVVLDFPEYLVKENDTSKLIPVYSNITHNNGATNMELPNQETLSEWINEYGIDNLITEPKVLKSKLLEYESE